MNGINQFSQWRPAVEPLDAERADRLWTGIVSELTTEITHDEQSIEVTLVAAAPQRARRPRAVALVTAAAAIVVLGVGGLALVRQPPDTPVAGSGATAPSEPAPVTEGWRAFPAPPLSPRFQGVTLTTGSGLFMWGGYGAGEQRGNTDGAYFDGQTWRKLPDAPLDGDRGDAVAAWTGTEAVVLNGIESPRAAAFDPTTFTWRELPAPHMSKIYNADMRLFPVSGEQLALTLGASVELFDIATETWGDPISAAGYPSAAELLDSDGETYVRVANAATKAHIAAITIPELGANGCSIADLAIYDVTAGTWTSPPLPGPARDWIPTDVVGLADGRFLLTGGTGCAEARPSEVLAAYLIDPTNSAAAIMTATPPVVLYGPRYGGVAIDDAVVWLHPSGSLIAYRPSSDTWSTGPSLVDPDGRVSDTPIAVLGDDVVVLSPGYGSAAGCCEPTGDAYSASLIDLLTLPPTVPITTPWADVVDTVVPAPTTFG